MDTVRTFGWDWRFGWSGQKYVTQGYLGDTGLKTNTDDQNNMYLVRNSSKKYEYAAANFNGDLTTQQTNMGYICEATLMCKYLKKKCLLKF